MQLFFIFSLFQSSLLFLSCAYSIAQEKAPTIKVEADRIRVYDEVSYTPQSVKIEQPASSAHLGETIQKLPGVMVLNHSGFGSLTTVITSQALGSGGVGVSIDGIPVINPTGNGIDFSIFPSALIGSVEQQFVFYPSEDPTAFAVSSPGGRINLKTLNPKGKKPFLGSVLLGSGKTVRATGAYLKSDQDKSFVAGLSGFNTAGDFHFKNPNSNQSQNRENRENNDAWGGGGLLKYKTKWSSHELEVLNLASHTSRTNPGPLGQPSRDHEKDTFELLGLKYSNPKAFSERDGIFSKLAGSYSRTDLIETPSSLSSTKTLGNYAQTGYHRKDEASSITVSFDNQYDYLKDSTGIYERDVFGSTATLSAEFGKFRLVPLARQEVGSAFGSVGDGSLSLSYLYSSASDFTMSYGLFHLYPSLVSVSGVTTPTFRLLPNPSLRVERDQVLALSYSHRHPTYTLYGSKFLNFIKNRSTFTSLSPTTAQIINVSDVFVFGYTLEVQLFPVEDLTLRASSTFSIAEDKNTKREIPYKPKLEGLFSASYVFLPELGLTAEEQWISKRFTNVQNSRTLSPYAQTHLRLDFKLWEGLAYFKVANVFDTAGFITDGFPLQGRSFWLGYTYGVQ